MRKQVLINLIITDYGIQPINPVPNKKQLAINPLVFKHFSTMGRGVIDNAVSRPVAKGIIA